MNDAVQALQLLMPYCGVALARLFPPAGAADLPASDPQLQRQQQQQTRKGAMGASAGVNLRRRHAMTAADERAAAAQQLSKQQPLKQRSQRSGGAQRRWGVLQAAAAAALLLQLPVAAYFGLLHQRCTCYPPSLAACFSFCNLHCSR